MQTSAWDARFPYAVGDLTGLPERHHGLLALPALTDAHVLAGSIGPQWVMTLDVPGRTPVRLVGTHPCNPYCGGGAFARDHASSSRRCWRTTPSRWSSPGDLNAIDDHAPLQRLRADGLRSATDLVGAGWVPTYPRTASFPPLLPIDHVLVDDQLTATVAAHRPDARQRPPRPGGDARRDALSGSPESVQADRPGLGFSAGGRSRDRCSAADRGPRGSRR